MPEIVVRGPRVVLRTAEADDLERLWPIRNEPGVTRWWGAADRADVAGALAEGGDSTTLIILVDGDVAGAVEWWENADPEFRHAGLDIYLGAAHQGRGLGREVVGLVIDHLIDVRGHHRLTIDPAADNVAAIRCYTAVGFRPVGTLREYQLLGSRWVDGLLMELLASDREG